MPVWVVMNLCTCVSEEGVNGNLLFVYYESIKRELNKRLIFECRCDAGLKAKAEGSTHLAYTRWSSLVRIVVYYESLNRELKTKPIKECRCDERLQTRVEESTRNMGVTSQKRKLFFRKESVRTVLGRQDIIVMC